MVGRAWRWLAALAAVGLVVAAVAGALVVRAGLLPRIRGAHPVSALRPRAASTPTPPPSCRMPVLTLSPEKGNSLAGGFLSLPDATYETDAGSGLSYDVRFHRWLPANPELVAPDGASYADWDKSGNVQLVDVASGSRRLLLPASGGRWAPRRFAAEGLYVDQSGSSVPGAGLSLLSLDGRLTPIADGGHTWSVIGSGAAWGFGYQGSLNVWRLDPSDHSVTIWFHPPPGTKFMYVYGLDTSGLPFIVFRGERTDPFRMGVLTGPERFSEAVQPAAMAVPRAFGLGYTDGRGLWMGLDGAGLLLYAPDRTLRLVSQVPANILRAAGSCDALAAATVQAQPAASAAPAPPVAPGPTRFAVAVPMHRQEQTLSCEEAALAMVTQFYGKPATEQQVFDQVGIDTTHYWAGRSGGGDPYVHFVGDPSGSEVAQTGYGVYWPPIKDAADHFGAPVARAGEGISPSALYDAVRQNHPAIAWVSYDLRPHPRSDYRAYDGRVIPYAGPFEHVMVVTGLSDTSVRVNDPDAGQYWVPIPQFEAAYAVYGQMAVVFG